MSEWIIPCNPNDYDVVGAFKALKEIDWKQRGKCKVGDTAYIYVGKPIKAIRYRCEVTQINMDEPEIDDIDYIIDDTNYTEYGRYMRLKLLDSVQSPELQLEKLKKNGLKTVQGPTKASDTLSAYISGFFGTDLNSLDTMDPVEIILRAYSKPMSARKIADVLNGQGNAYVQTENTLEALVDAGRLSVDDSDDESLYYYAYQAQKPHYFYVHQGRSFDEECSGGFLRAPKNGKDGRLISHWDRMKNVKEGDIILHGGNKMLLGISVARADAYEYFWENTDGGFDGWRVDSDYCRFQQTIQPQDYWDDLKMLIPSSEGPFNYKGGGNQGYLFEANQSMTEFLIDKVSEAGSIKPGPVGNSYGTVSAASTGDEDEEVEELLEQSIDAVISGYVSQFESILPECKKEEKELEELRKKFVEDFYTYKTIENMTIDDYVIGKQNENSFCYRLENELVRLGNIHGATSMKFGLYYGELGDDTTKKYRIAKKFGTDPEAALEEIKREIVLLRINGEKDNYAGIDECRLSNSVRGKILATYFPEKYLPIFSMDHLNYFLDKIGIVVDQKASILERQNALLDWKNSVDGLSGLSNYLFMRFLYYSFDRPGDDEKAEKDIQKQRDKEYPRKYVKKVKITISKWMDMLKDPEVFHEGDIDLMKRFYVCDNHATSCYDLGVQDGVSPSTYIKPVVALARRVSEWADLDPIYRENGKRAWWPIIFWGRYREDTHFEWKLQPDLAKAMKRVFPELDADEINDEEDNKLIEELKPASLANADDDFEYIAEPKEKAAPVFTNGHKTYPRDRQTAINALAHAHYQCEIDTDHPTFIRKHSNKPYTEPHHLVPMAFSDKFKVTLDREQNIVSLCSNCHNQIHYGRDAAKLVEKLYEARKDDLEAVGIKITLDELFKMYHIPVKH